MADNTTLPTSDLGGDVLRTEQHTPGGPKTPVSLIDVGGTSGTEAVIGDVGVTMPVSGTVTANLGAVDNAVLDAIAASVAGTLTVGSHAVTNAGTFACQIDGSALTALQSIDTKTPALGQALAAASVPVVLTAAQLSTLTPPAAITGFATESTLSSLNGKVTAINTGAVTISTWSAGSIAVTDGGGSLTVDGTVAATQSGNWSARLQDGAGNAITSATRGSERALTVQIVDGSGTQITAIGGGTQYTEGDTDASITGTAILWESGANVLTPVNYSNPMPVVDQTCENQLILIRDYVDGLEGLLTTIDADTGTLSVVGGGAEATALRVTIASDSTGVVSIDDNGGSITVDGTIAVSGSVTVVNAGTFAVQSTLQAGTAYAGKVRLTDGTTDAEVVPLTGYNAQAVAIVDGSGNQITSFGGGTQYTEGDTDATITGTAMLMEGAGNALVAAQGTAADGLLVNLGSNNDVTVTSGTVTVQDGGGSITVDGTFWQATQPVSVASVPSHDVTNAGTFAVQAAQSGTWNVTNISGTVSLPTGAATAAKQPALGTAGTASADVITVQGIASMTAIKTDGSGVTQPVSGTVTANAGSGTFAVSNAGITSLDGKITACNTGAVVLAAGTAAFGKLAANSGVDIGDVDVLTINGVAPAFGSGVRGATVQRVTIATDDVVPISDNGGSITVDGTVAVTGTFWQATQPVSGTVTATISAGATTIAKAEDVASADADVGVPSMAVRKATPANTSGTDGDYEFLQMSAGRLWTSTVVDTALPAGSNAIGKLASNSGVTIGAVEIASAQTLATVTTVSTVTTCSTVTTLTGGGVAHDGADSGNPIKVGARAAATLSDDTMVANADRTDLVSDVDGAVINRPNFPIADILSDAASNTDGASTASSVFTATASTRSCITGFQVFRTDAGTTPIYIDFRDGTGGSVLWRAVLPAGGGANSPAYCGPCLFRTSANTALAYDVSAATTTVYINVSGYKSKV